MVCHRGQFLAPNYSFILYINDICNVSKLLRFILFANDKNIFNKGDNLDALSKEISAELDKLHIWFNVNKLSLNVQKTNFIIVGNRHDKKYCIDYSWAIKLDKFMLLNSLEC